VSGQDRRAARARRAASKLEGRACPVPGSEAHGGRRAFTEAEELIGGYWLWRAKSKEAAIERALCCPAADGDVLELEDRKRPTA